MLPDLNELLQYQNDSVLALYRQNYPNNQLKAEEAFKEVLKYLWLSKKHQQDLKENHHVHLPKECFMPRSMTEIDQMWHEFILFTEDYMAFCQKYFGEYMHHMPNVFDYRPRRRQDVEEDIEKLICYIYDNLDEATVRTWFSIYLDEFKDGQPQ